VEPRRAQSKHYKSFIGRIWPRRLAAPALELLLTYNLFFEPNRLRRDPCLAGDTRYTRLRQTVAASKQFTFFKILILVWEYSNYFRVFTIFILDLG
jgi:hypothetical protein